MYCLIYTIVTKRIEIASYGAALGYLSNYASTLCFWRAEMVNTFGLLLIVIIIACAIALAWDMYKDL